MPGRVLFAPSYQKPGLECSSWDEDVMSLARRESRVDFPEALVQPLDPSRWKLTACGSFFREEHIVVLEPRSIFYAVRYTERSIHRDASFILSGQSCAGAGALQRTLKTFYIAFSCASYFFVWLQGRFCLLIQVDTVDLFR